MKRRSNAALFVCALVVLFCSACSRSAAHYLTKGNELYASGKFVEASLNYRKAVRQDPESGEAYYKLGLSAIKLNDPRGAFEALGRAAQLSPHRDDIQLAFGDFCLSAYVSDPQRPKQLYDAVTRVSDEFLAKDKNSFAGLRMKGYVALLESRPAEAAGYFERAHQQRPNQPDVAISLVESLLQDGREDAAEQLAREYIQSHREYGPAYDALYAHYLGRHRNTQAEEILKLKISNNPDEPSYAGQLAQFYWRSGKQKYALELIAKILANPKRPASAHLTAGDFYGFIGQWKDATEQFEQGIRAAPDQKLVFQKRLANVFLAQGRKDRAVALVDEMGKQNPNDEDVRWIRADLRMESGQPNDVASAVADYRTLLRTHSREPKLHYALGRALQTQGELASAKLEFQTAVSIQPDYGPPRLALLQVALAERKFDRAVQTANELLAADPKNPEVRLLKAVALRNLGKPAQARSELQRIIRTHPTKSAYLQLGLLEIDQKNYRKGESIFRELQNLGGDASEASAGMAVLYSQRGQLDKAKDVLGTELEKSFKNPVLHQLMAEIELQAKDYDSAIGEYRVLIGLNPSSNKSYLQLAEAFRLKGDTKQYIATLEQAGRLFPDDFATALTLGEALDSVGRRGEAIQQYRRALARQPDDPRVLNNLAYSMTENNGNLEEALSLAQRAVRKWPNQSAFVDTLGWIYVKKNMTDSALQIFEGLVKKYPNDPSFRYHFGVALLQKGDKQRAKTTLESALANKPSQEDAEKIRRLLATIG